MKNSTMLLAAAAILYITGCTQPKVSDMMKNDAQKKEIFSAILSDDSLSSQLMDSLMVKHPEQMMMKMHSMVMSNKSMQENMMGKMMDMCKTDSSMCRMMMSNMMDMCNTDSSMCKMMMKSMQSRQSMALQ